MSAEGYYYAYGIAMLYCNGRQHSSAQEAWLEWLSDYSEHRLLTKETESVEYHQVVGHLPSGYAVSVVGEDLLGGWKAVVELGEVARQGDDGMELTLVTLGLEETSEYRKAGLIFRQHA